MKHLEQSQTKKRILETIDLMGNKEVPDFMRIIYHNKALKLLTEYKGKDFNELMNKYLETEWRR